MPPQTAPTTVKAGIYLRISQDSEKDELGVRRQEKEGRKLAKRLGWPVVDVYCDNDVSAYKRRGKRADYERMLNDIKSGRINGIITLHSDRLYRRTRDLTPFIDLVNEHNTAIQTVFSGEIDLTTPVGRLHARTLSNIAEYESDLKAQRIQSKIDELVAAGKVHNGGPRPFGFERVYSGEGPRRKIVEDRLNEVEAALIREARDRVFAGKSRYSIVNDWTRRGIKTSTGRMWSIQALTLMLVSGRIAGLKEHHRVVVGKASWPAIISVDDHRRLKAILTARGRNTAVSRPGWKYWMSGSVICSDCRVPMKAGPRGDNGKTQYRCPRDGGGCGGRTIGYHDLDKMMTNLVVARLNNPQLLRGLAEREADHTGESEQLVAAIDSDERQLQLLEGQMAAEGNSGEDDIIELVGAARTVRRRLRANRDRLARLAGASPLLGLDVRDLANRWKPLPVEQKAALLKVAGVEKIVIHPARFAGRFDPDRVGIEPVPAVA